MPHRTINSYPTIGKEVELPIFMRAVGCNENQPEQNMPEGYLYHQIFFVETGEVDLAIGGKHYRFTRSMGFFLPAFLPYHLKSVTECMTHWVSFGCACEERLLPLIDFQNFRIFPRLEIKPLIMDLKKMYLLSTEDTFYSRCRNSARIYSYIMEVYAQDKKYSEQIDQESENPALLLAKRYIEQYYFNDLTLDIIAEYAHVSPQHLCRLFQKHMGMRPTSYLNLTRIKIAKWLLNDTDKSVTEIAEKVGYHSPFYFSTTFKKYENISPSAWRKLVKQN